MALITATQVINKAFTNLNTDTALIKDAFIQIAELNHVQPNIGERLYEEISNEITQGVVWTDNIAAAITIKCVADVAGSLHHEYLTVYTTDDMYKWAVYMDINGGGAMATPVGFTGVIQVDLTASGQDSTAAQVATALGNALNSHVNPVTTTADFTATVATDAVTLGGITNMTYPEVNTTGFTLSGGGFNVTSGSTTITCIANSFIKPGDFISGTGIPVKADGPDDNKGLCKVETVDTPGAVTSFKISGTPTATNSAASLTIRRPNGVLKEDYIVNYLAFCVKFEILPDMTYNTTSQGVVENVADFTLPVSEKKLNFLRNETFKKAETYLRLMHDFINENKSPIIYKHYANENAGGVSKKNGIIIY
jgi:hypothetical protein